MTRLLPAPVSPVKTVNPSLKETSIFSIIAKLVMINRFNIGIIIERMRLGAEVEKNKDLFYLKVNYLCLLRMGGVDNLYGSCYSYLSFF